MQSSLTDHEIGRVIQTIEDLGKLDNTMIIFISGDNGASAEVSEVGTPNEVLPWNGIQLSAADQMKWYDAWGYRPDISTLCYRLGLGV